MSLLTELLIPTIENYKYAAPTALCVPKIGANLRHLRMKILN
ncbi:MAG: hypothetical protein WDM76_17595 [Limisphaerales bacterium]